MSRPLNVRLPRPVTIAVHCALFSSHNASSSQRYHHCWRFDVTIERWLLCCLTKMCWKCSRYCALERSPCELQLRVCFYGPQMPFVHKNSHTCVWVVELVDIQAASAGAQLMVASFCSDSVSSNEHNRQPTWVTSRQKSMWLCSAQLGRKKWEHNHSVRHKILFWYCSSHPGHIHVHVRVKSCIKSDESQWL